MRDIMLLCVLAGVAGAQSDSAAIATLVGHQVIYSGIPGCDIDLEIVAGSVEVGLAQTWKATPVGTCPADPVLQFGLRAPGQSDFSMKRDFATRGSAVDALTRAKWSWTAMAPGDHQVRVILKASYDSPASERVEVVSDPVAVPTPMLDTPRASSHPLVAVYTTPDRSCDTLAVRFQKDDGDDEVDQPWQRTNSLPCTGGDGLPKTFFVAGMEASTTYKVQLVVDGHPFRRVRRFTTPAIPSNVHVNETTTDPARDPLQTVVRATDSRTDTNLSIHWDVYNRSVWNADNLIGTPMFKTIAEQPVWYWHLASMAPELNNPIVARKTNLELFAYARDANAPPNASNASLNLIREIDLAGMPLGETSLRALDQRAQHRQFGIHHDVQRVGENRRLAITYTARCKHPNVTPEMPDDPGDEPDVSSSWLPVCPCTRAGCDPTRTEKWFGDGLLLVEEDGAIAWEWSAFDHLPTNRPPPNAYPVCVVPNGECPLLGAREYTHSNSISFSPDHSILLLSMRYQDWVLALDFRDGVGTGDVFWRLGRDGSFLCVTTRGDPCPALDPSEDTMGQPAQDDPWFSHQHTAHFLGADRVLLFDNGNRRCTAGGAAADFTCYTGGIRSRLQLYRLELDESGAPTQAVRERNLVLAAYSSAFGTAQLLPNGNLLGDLGNIPVDATANTPRISYAEEIATDAISSLPVQTYTYCGREPFGGVPATGGRAYRATRVSSLYTSSPP